MVITLIRNGQTEEDFLNKIEGRTNNLMNDTGRRQCQNLSLRIKDNKYDLCFSSPLTKCVETAMILVGDRVRIISDQRIIDRDMGSLTGCCLEEYNKYKFWDYNINREDYGVETIKTLFSRCNDFLDFIINNYKDKKILIVTHEEIFRVLKHIILKDSLQDNLLTKEITNCYMEDFEYGGINEKKTGICK